MGTARFVHALAPRSGSGVSTQNPTLLIADPLREKLVSTCVPKKTMATKQTTAMRLTRREYSTKLAPLSPVALGDTDS